MPPTAGVGLGIDRLTMILTGARTLREVVLFPAMRTLSAAATRNYRQSLDRPRPVPAGHETAADILCAAVSAQPEV